MKKFVLFIFFISLVFFTINVDAAYLKNIPQEINQPDGTIINCFASGDEFHNWVHDENDFTIIQNPETGLYVYAIIVNGKLVASSYRVGTVDPKQVGIKPGLNITPEEWKKKREAYFNLTENARNTRMPSTGTVNNLCVFIRFSDQTEFPGSYSSYSDDFNASTGNSLANYYDEVSNEQLDVNSYLYPNPSGDVIVSYQDSHSRNYFCPYNAVTNPIGYENSDQRAAREWQLIRDAITAVNPQIPSGIDFDADDDGEMDNAVFIIRGAPTAWNTLLWPHKWSIGSAPYPVVNGATLVVYNFQIETMFQVGVLCHEMFHSIGAPDLYHYTSNGIAPVGPWDLMETTSNPPQHMLTFMKWKYGQWFSTLTVISSPGTYTLSPVSTSQYSCYKIASPYSADEYFMVEYRRDEGTFESSIPGSGLIVYRIDTTAGDGNASGPPDEVYVYRPGGTTVINGNVNHANFSQDVGRTAIHEFSDPTPFLQDGSAGGLILYDIGSSGSSILFTYATDMPFFWEGDVSSNWNTSSNWVNNAIPSLSDNVIIPSGTTYSPIIGNGLTAYCKDLTIKSGATLTQTGTSYFYVHGDFDSDYGTFTQSGLSYLYFDGSSDTHWDDDNEDDIYTYVRVNKNNSTALLTMWQDMTVENNFEVREGEFQINASWTLTVNSTASNAFEIEDGGTLTLSGNKTIDVAGGVEFEDGSRENITGGTIKCGGSLRILANASYNITFSGGLLEMDGSSTQYIDDQDGGTLDLYNLKINKSSGTCHIYNADLDVNGYLTISAGILDSDNYDIYVCGNWTNNVGDAGFVEGTQTVIFDGAGAADILTNETFYNLHLDKTYSAYDALETGSGNGNGVDVTVTNNLRLYDGTMELNNPTNLTIGNILWIYDGASLNANDSGTINISVVEDWFDYNASEGFSAGSYSVVTFNGTTPGAIQQVRENEYFNDIVINSSSSYVRPSSTGPTIYCKNMNVIVGKLKVASYKVVVDEDMNISSTLEMSSSEDSLLVDNVTWESGSSDLVTDGKIFVSGNWTFNNGTSAQLGTVNTVYFDGSQSQFIYCMDADAEFGNLVIDMPAMATWIHSSSTEDMHVAGNMTVTADDAFQIGTSNLLIDGILDIENNGVLYLEHVGGTLTNNSDFTLNGELNIDGGDALIHGEFELATTGTLIIDGGSFISDAPYSRDRAWQYIRGNFNLSNGLFEITNNSLSFASTCNDNITGGTIRTGYAFSATHSGTFEPSGGEVEFVGTSIGNIFCSNGNYFHDFIINKTSGAGYLQTDITVQNDVTINSGALNANGYDMYVGGNWTNNVGDSGFVEGTSRVIFNGSSGHQYCSNETFNELEINKPSAAFRLNGTTVTCNSYDWTSGALDVLSGTFTALDLADIGIFGNFYVNPGGTINLHQDSSHYIDLNGSLTFSGGGTINIYGGLMTSYWPFYANASITMSGGTLDFKDNGIYINNSASYTLTESITGGTIRTAYSFTGDRTDFNPAGGIIELYGTTDASLSMGIGSNFYDVQINKAASDNIKRESKNKKRIIQDRDGSVIELTRSNTVNAASELDINGDLLIDNGTFNLSGYTVDVANDVHNYGELTVEGTFEIGNDFYLYSGSTVDLSGTIHLGTYSGKHGIAIHYSGSTFNQTGGHYYIESIHLYNGSQFNGTDGITHIYVDGHVVNNNIEIDDPDSYFYYFYVETGANAALYNCSYDLEVNYTTNLYGPLDINSYTMNTLYSNVYDGCELIIDSGGTVNVTGNGPYFQNGGTLTMESGSELNCEQHIRFYSGSTENVSGGEIFVAEDFLDANEIFSPTGGSVTFDGSSASLINGTIAFYDLYIDKTGATVTANSPLGITHDLVINSGVLDPDVNAIEVGGNWTNNVGASGFAEGTQTVTFNGNNNADITTDETFYNLTIDKTSGSYFALEIMDGVTINVTNDLNISDGTIEMNTGSTLNIDNDFVIALNAGLNAFGDTGLNIYIAGDWTNNNTTYDSWIGFYPGTSTVTFNGSSSQYVNTNCPDEDFYNLTIDKSAGNFLPSNNIKVLGDLSIADGSWSYNSAGLTHYVFGDLSIMADGSWNDNTGTIIFKGTSDQT
ncbi:MAG: M6 family metalloprotease domain-containing protein, partial [Candidatus Cloacimonetes bacterium]|nr:M6 family metalloprotease domain-containing protein [Candidatus Cloacimonadota bacterium]